MIVDAVVRILNSALLVTAFMTLLAPASLAQETREYDLPRLEDDVRQERSLGDLIKVGVKASNRFVGVADFGDYRANSYQPEFRVRLTAPLAENVGIRLMGTGRVLHYDFDDSDADLGIGRTSGGPFDDLYSWTARLQGAYLGDESWTLFSESERWSLLLDLFIRAGWEKGASVSDAVRGGTSAAVGYRLGKTLELALGVSVRTKLRTGSLSVAPVAEVDWRINDQWKLSSQGMGLQLERRLGERFTLFTRARWEGSSYLLDDRGVGIGDAFLRIRQLPAGVGFWWNAGRHLRITALAGVMAIHKLRVEDEKGREIDTDTADPSPYFLVRFDLKS